MLLWHHGIETHAPNPSTAAAHPRNDARWRVDRFGITEHDSDFGLTNGPNEQPKKAFGPASRF
jgi:hypothetical protein